MSGSPVPPVPNGHDKCGAPQDALPPLAWRGTRAIRNQWLLGIAGWYVLMAACLVGSVLMIREAESMGGWLEGGLLLTASVLGLTICPVLFGLDPLKGASIVTSLDSEGLTVDRREINRGVLRVPWSDVESIYRHGFTVGLVLHSYDGLLSNSDDAALADIAKSTLFFRVAQALKLASGPSDAVELVAGMHTPTGACDSRHAAVRKGAIKALRLGRQLGNRELDFRMWERDVATHEFQQRIQTYFDQARANHRNPAS
jgi:hypothetical protein